MKFYLIFMDANKDLIILNKENLFEIYEIIIKLQLTHNTYSIIKGEKVL